MPWMPEVFTTPMAAARRVQDEEATSTNDAVPYYEGILADEPNALVRSFAARQPVLDDPRVGYVEGTRELRAFASGTAEWLRERDAVVENVALTLSTTRTVEEVVLNLLADNGARVELPVAIVTDRNPDRTVKVVRLYHSTWPLTGEHRVRPPLLPADPNLHVEGVPGDYQRALAEGDLEGILATFEPEGYAREPASGGGSGLRARQERAFGGGAHLRRRGAAGRLGHLNKLGQELPRIHIPRTPLNNGDEARPELLRPGPA